jgi:pyruvate oxidase
VIGYGAKDVRDKVIALAEKMDAPVLTTFKGKGLIPDTHPLPPVSLADQEHRLPAGS